MCNYVNRSSVSKHFISLRIRHHSFLSRNKRIIIGNGLQAFTFNGGQFPYLTGDISNQEIVHFSTTTWKRWWFVFMYSSLVESSSLLQNLRFENHIIFLNCSQCVCFSVKPWFDSLFCFSSGFHFVILSFSINNISSALCYTKYSLSSFSFKIYTRACSFIIWSIDRVTFISVSKSIFNYIFQKDSFIFWLLNSWYNWTVPGKFSCVTAIANLSISDAK